MVGNPEVICTVACCLRRHKSAFLEVVGLLFATRASALRRGCKKPNRTCGGEVVGVCAPRNVVVRISHEVGQQHEWLEEQQHQAQKPRSKRTANSANDRHAREQESYPADHYRY